MASHVVACCRPLGRNHDLVSKIYNMLNERRGLLVELNLGATHSDRVSIPRTLNRIPTRFHHHMAMTHLTRCSLRFRKKKEHFQPPPPEKKCPTTSCASETFHACCLNASPMLRSWYMYRKRQITEPVAHPFLTVQSGCLPRPYPPRPVCPEV